MAADFPLFNLPIELQLDVVMEFALKDLLAFSRASKACRQLALDNSVWKGHCASGLWKRRNHFNLVSRGDIPAPEGWPAFLSSSYDEHGMACVVRLLLSPEEFRSKYFRMFGLILRAPTMPLPRLVEENTQKLGLTHTQQMYMSRNHIVRFSILQSITMMSMLHGGDVFVDQVDGAGKAVAVGIAAIHAVALGNGLQVLIITGGASRSSYLNRTLTQLLQRPVPVVPRVRQDNEPWQQEEEEAPAAPPQPLDRPPLIWQAAGDEEHHENEEEGIRSAEILIGEMPSIARALRAGWIRRDGVKSIFIVDAEDISFDGDFDYVMGPFRKQPIDRILSRLPAGELDEINALQARMTAGETRRPQLGIFQSPHEEASLFLRQFVRDPARVPPVLPNSMQPALRGIKQYWMWSPNSQRLVERFLRLESPSAMQCLVLIRAVRPSKVSDEIKELPCRRSIAYHMTENATDLELFRRRETNVLVAPFGMIVPRDLMMMGMRPFVVVVINHGGLTNASILHNLGLPAFVRSMVPQIPYGVVYLNRTETDIPNTEGYVALDSALDNLHSVAARLDPSFAPDEGHMTDTAPELLNLPSPPNSAPSHGPAADVGASTERGEAVTSYYDLPLSSQRFLRDDADYMGPGGGAGAGAREVSLTSSDEDDVVNKKSA